MQTITPTLERGLRKLIPLLKKEGFLFDRITYINKNRYAILLGDTQNYMVIYKREVFYNFGKMFRDKGYKGVGDSINCEDLKKAMAMNVNRIYTIYPTGAVYCISMVQFLTDSIKWQNKEGKEIRSISIHEYNREYTLK